MATQVESAPPVVGPGVHGIASAPDERVTIIRPPTRLPRFDFRELWAYRELLGVFVWRDLSVRYKQAAVGIAWAIFQPLFTAIVYTVIFGKFAAFPRGGIAYPVLAVSGLVVFQLFSSALSTGAISVVANVNLVTKVYFPRLLLPITTVLTPVVDFVFGLTVLIAFMAYYGQWPAGPEVLLAPLFVGLAALTALGLALGLSAINVRYRDVPYALPVFLQVLPLLSGVPYAVHDGLPEKWQWILSLNPLTGAISGFRWAVVGSAAPDLPKLGLGIAVAIVLFVAGFVYFRSAEPRFADQI